MEKRQDNNEIERRILKYEQYVKEHPKKAYGYYCLGRLPHDGRKNTSLQKNILRSPLPLTAIIPFQL